MYHADYERRIAQLERDNANLRELIADLKPRVENIESDLAAIMQEEPEAYDEHGFVLPIAPGERLEKGDMVAVDKYGFVHSVPLQMENPGC